MKIVFLDIDGVLNNNKRFTKEKGTYVLDPISCGIFVDFVERNDIKVVLSSTWRLHEGHVQFLTQAGILDNKHEDWRTIDGYKIGSRWNAASRGEEVKEWLSRHPEITHYAIIDDIVQFLPEQQSYFINTDEHTGLKPEHILKLAEILEINKD